MVEPVFWKYREGIEARTWTWSERPSGGRDVSVTSCKSVAIRSRHDFSWSARVCVWKVTS